MRQGTEEPDLRTLGKILAEEGGPDGCGPYGCRSGMPVRG
jgi:hypothetical protein